MILLLKWVSANHTFSQRQGKGGLDCGLLIYGKTDNKNVQLVLQHFCKMSGKVKLLVLPLAFKHVSQQVRLLQVAWTPTSDWLKLRGSHLLNLLQSKFILEPRLQQTLLKRKELLSGGFSFVRTGRPNHCWTSHFDNEIGFFQWFCWKTISFLHTIILGFDWSDWIVLINSEILITTGRVWSVLTNGKHPLRLSLLQSGVLCTWLCSRLNYSLLFATTF